MSELSADAKALIEQSREDDAPCAEDKQRIRARLAAQLGAGAFAGVALVGSALEVAPAATKSVAIFKSALLRWIAGALTAGGLAVGAYGIASPKPVPKPVVPVATHQVEPPSVAAPVVEPTPPVIEQAVAKVEAPKPLRKRIAKQAPAFSPVGSSATMSAEIALLAQAQKALRARDGKEALRLAQRHAENFPSGALYEERLGIEAIAHCVLGERDHASVRRFLARSPRSPLSARVRKECGVP